jgi:hypothetical protein
MHKMGKRVVSIDPLYIYDAKDIESQFNAVVDDIISQVKQTPDDWVWSYHNSADHLKEYRVKVLNKFLQDYVVGKKEGRYVTGELPQLNVATHEYDIALCSHLLFLYSEQLDFEFHLAAILELLRVAKEIRVFPLLSLALNMSPYLKPLIRELEATGYEVRIQKVEYEFQKGGNEMLRVIKA